MCFSHIKSSYTRCPKKKLTVVKLIAFKKGKRYPCNFCRHNLCIFLLALCKVSNPCAKHNASYEREMIGRSKVTLIERTGCTKNAGKRALISPSPFLFHLNLQNVTLLYIVQKKCVDKGKWFHSFTLLKSCDNIVKKIQFQIK